MNVDSNERDSGNLEVIHKVTSTIGGAAGWLIVLYGIAYLAGYEYLRNYTKYLGVPWAIGLYGPMDLIQVPSAFGSLAIVVILQLTTHRGFPGIIKWKHMAFFGLTSLAMLACHFAVVRFMANYTSLWIVPAISLGLLTVFTASILIHEVATDRFGAFRGSIFFSTFALGLSFIAIPEFAQYVAKKDIQRVKDGKSRIRLVGPEEHEWQIVRAIPSNQLLIATVNEGKKISFRIIATTDPLGIESSKQTDLLGTQIQKID